MVEPLFSTNKYGKTMKKHKKIEKITIVFMPLILIIQNVEKKPKVIFFRTKHQN
jgi:hypothetical protein